MLCLNTQVAGLAQEKRSPLNTRNNPCFGIPQNDYGDLSLLAAAKSALALAPKPM